MQDRLFGHPHPETFFRRRGQAGQGWDRKILEEEAQEPQEERPFPSSDVSVLRREKTMQEQNEKLLRENPYFFSARRTKSGMVLRRTIQFTTKSRASSILSRMVLLAQEICGSESSVRGSCDLGGKQPTSSRDLAPYDLTVRVSE